MTLMERKLSGTISFQRSSSPNIRVLYWLPIKSVTSLDVGLNILLRSEGDDLAIVLIALRGARGLTLSHLISDFPHLWSHSRGSTIVNSLWYRGCSLIGMAARLPISLLNQRVTASRVIPKRFKMTSRLSTDTRQVE